MSDHTQLLSSRSLALPPLVPSRSGLSPSVNLLSSGRSASLHITSASCRPAASDDAITASARQREAGARDNHRATFSVSPSPRINEKAWYFHTTLLSSVSTFSSDDDGGQQPHSSGDVQINKAPPVVEEEVEPADSPNSELAACNGASAAPKLTIPLELNRLFFKDAPFFSGTGPSLVDSYSLRALYAFRCASLGTRQAFPALQEQLPSDIGQDAANRLRMLVARDTYFPARACQALSVLLPYCPNLEYIDFRNAGLRSKSGSMTGLNALLDALLLGAGYHHPTVGAALHTIDVSFNELNDRTGLRLLRLVQQQPCIRVVNTEGTAISTRINMRIVEELSKNSEKYTRLSLAGQVRDDVKATTTEELSLA